MHQCDYEVTVKSEGTIETGYFKHVLFSKRLQGDEII